MGVSAGFKVGQCDAMQCNAMLQIQTSTVPYCTCLQGKVQARGLALVMFDV